MLGDSTATTPKRGNQPLHVDLVVVARSPDPGVAGKVVVLSSDRLDIGRSGHVEGPLSLSDPEVSRRHASLVLDAPSDAWQLSDQGSHNGSLLNGERVTAAELGDGDVLRIGSTLLVFRRILDFKTDALMGDRTSLRGPSIEMQRVRGEIARAGRDASPVLVLGESGVGKELAASEIHRTSGRTGRLVTVNCAGLPEHLAESELFGHKAGAFTGAAGDRDGLFVAAEGGTLLLDEIGEMPLSLQAKLLRVLATGEVRPVGSHTARRVDVRIVAATNRELRDEVERGTFRGDLFARLAGWLVRIPPLRRRREDVLALATHVLEQRGSACAIDADAAEALLLYDWPFNVRELEHVITVAMARAPRDVLELEHLPAELRAPVERRVGPVAARPRDSAPQIERLFAPFDGLGAPEPHALFDGRGAPEPHDTQRALPALRDSSPARPSSPGSSPPSAGDAPSEAELTALLERFGGNVQRVASEIGRDRRQVYRWLERHGIDPGGYRIPPEEVLRAELERFEGNVARVSASLGTNRMQIYRWARRYGIEVAGYRRDDGSGEPEPG